MEKCFITVVVVVVVGGGFKGGVGREEDSLHRLP